MQETLLESFRLSPQQRHVCALQPSDAAAPFPYRTYTLVRLEGSLEIDHLRSAVNQVIARHEILRTSLTHLPGLSLPMQVISPTPQFAFSLRDLSTYSPQERETVLRQLLEQPENAPLPSVADPIVQVTLLREQSDVHLLLLSLPAVNADTISCQLLLRELSQYYGHMVVSEDDPMQYADLAEWQYELLTSEETATERAYWRERDQQIAAQALLPFEQALSSSAPFTPASYQLMLSADKCEAFDELAQQWQVSTPALLLACWAYVLTYLTEQSDLLIGTSFSGRSYDELTEAPGLFAKYLPLSYCVTAQTQPIELAQQIEAQLLEAGKWQEYFSWDIWRPQLSAQEPFCSFGFEFARLPDPWQVGSLRFTFLTQQQVLDRFTVQLSCLQHEQDLQLTLLYDRNRFSSAQMRQLLGNYYHVLEQLLTAPQRPFYQLTLLTHDEEQWLQSWNSTQQELAGSLSLLQRFEQQVARTPEALALHADDMELSYQDLDRRANQLAHFLRQEYGVSEEVCVAICMAPSSLQIVTVLAVLKAGGAYLPLDPATPSERLAFMLQDADVALLLTQESLREQLAPLAVLQLSLDQEWERIALFPAETPALVPLPEQLAYILYTSGSTGTPKGVMVTQRGLLNYVLWASDYYQVAEGQGTLLHSPLTFDLTVTSLFPPLLTGRRIIIAPPQAAGQGLSTSLQSCESLSLLKVTPTHLELLRQSMPASQFAGRSQVLIVGGEALQREHLTTWQTHAPQTRLINEYGPTETVVGCAVFEVPGGWREAGAVPIGRPIANTRLYVLDAWGQQVPVGMAGELFIGGDGVARGYLGRPALTAERFVPDPFSARAGARLYRSGDRVRMNEAGDLVFLGRLDQQVKIRGYRIELEEIEAHLQRHPQVREAVVIARSQPGEEARLVAYLVGEPAGELTVETLRMFLQQRLPEYMVPSTYVLLEQMPVTRHGKVDRQALPAPDEGVLGQGVGYVAPRREEEEVLVGIWSQVLGTQRIGIDDNYFALGGDSIRSIEVITQAQERGLHLSVDLLFRFPTIRGLAEAVQQHEGQNEEAGRIAPFALLSASDREQVPQEVEDAYPLTMLQGGMLFHNEFSPGEGVYHDIFSYHVRLTINVPALQEAAQALVARHEVLRTAFDLTGYSEPLQLVYREGPEILSVEDLQHLSAEQQERAIEAWIAQEKVRGFLWSRPPLLRIHVQLRSSETAQFTLSFHHAIIDGWSDAILLKELFTHYYALLKHESLALPAPVAHYRDFVALERAAMASLACQAYWDNELQGSSFTTIPRWLQPKGAVEKGVHVVPVPLSEEVSQGLKDLALATAVPIKNVLLAAHMRVLSLLSVQQDVTTCMVSGGRPEGKDGERVLGLFINSIPFRQQLSGGSWRDLVLETFALEREALPYRRYPMAEIKRRHGGLHISETLFYFTHYHILSELQEQKNIEILGWIPYEMSSFPLAANFFVDPFSSSVNLSVTCDGTQFSQEQAHFIANYYATALTAMATSPQERYEVADLIPLQERALLLQKWNATQKDYRSDGGLHSWFEEQVERTPMAVAVAYGQKLVSYRDLNVQANQVAHQLRQLGVLPDTLVGVYMERSDTLLVALLSILKVGGTYVPLDITYPTDRIEYMLQDAQIAIVLTQGHLRDQLSFFDHKILCIDTNEETASVYPVENLNIIVAPQNLAYVIYTSGSTGRPKGTAIYQQSFKNLLSWFINDFGISAQDKVLIVTSFSFDLTQKNLFAPLLVGGTVYLPPPGYDIAIIRRLMREVGITMLNCTPGMIYPLLNDAQSDGFKDLAALRQVFLGGEPIALSQLRAWMQSPDFAAEIVNTYGPTECTDVVASYRIHIDDQFVENAVPIGTPIANIEAYLLDQHLNLVPVGTAGELYLGGVGLAMGYLHQPALTAERFVPHPFSKEEGARLYRTGDIACYRMDGVLKFLGRLDYQIKIRGFRIELEEIEMVLGQLSMVQQCAVLVHMGSAEDKRLTAYIVLCKGQEVTSGQLRQALGSFLPQYMIPETFIVMEQLPLTPNGKIDRRVLLASQVQPLEETNTYVAPRTPVESLLQKIWGELLLREMIGIHSNFFELGGHSLLATILVSKMRETFQVELPLRVFFDTPTIAGLAAKIESNTMVAASESSQWAMLTEIESLSDEEIDRLLEQEERVSGENE